MFPNIEAQITSRSSRAFDLRSRSKFKLPQKTESTFQIDDFYLTKINTNLAKTSRTFEKTKRNHIENLVKVKNQSVLNNSLSTNIFVRSTVSIPVDEDCRPSYGEYASTMPNEIRMLFHKSVNMKNIFKDFDKAYFCLEEIKERVKCYKIDLGVIMEQNVVNLKRIVDRMLTTASRIIHDHKETNDNILKKNLKEVEKIVDEKNHFESKSKQTDQLMQMYKCERDYMEHSVQCLEKELEFMREKHKNLITKISTEKIFESEEEQISGGKKKMMERLYDSMKSISDDFHLIIGNWQQSVDGNKGELLNMEDVIRKMMIGGKTDKAMQVNELELKWGIEDVIRRDVIEHEPYITNIDVRSTSVAIESHPEYLKRIDPIDDNQKLRIDEANQTITAATVHKLNPDDSSISVDEDENRVEDLNSRNQKKVDTWRLPLSLVLFLDSAFKTHSLVRVIPWLSLRKIIMAIYTDRIKTQHTMEGGVMTGYISLEEYVPLYFLKISKVRRIAENQLLEFISSLKYYSKIWPRANLFSKLSNMLGIASFPGTIESSKLNMYDIFTQIFVFWVFEKLLADQSKLNESSEGLTILGKREVLPLLDKLCFFAGSDRAAKIKLDITKESKGFNIDSKNVEGFDIDVLANKLVNEFIEERKNMMKQMRTRFSKNYHVDRGKLLLIIGYISLDDFKKIVDSEPRQKVDMYVPPTEDYYDLVYLYASTCNDDNRKIELKDFITACHKFGLDSPFPCIFWKGRLNLEEGDSTHSM